MQGPGIEKTGLKEDAACHDSQDAYAASRATGNLALERALGSNSKQYLKQCWKMISIDSADGFETRWWVDMCTGYSNVINICILCMSCVCVCVYRYV